MVKYVHESGLCFNVERLVSADEQSSHDICVIVVWLNPNVTGVAMEIVDWYCGDPDAELTKEFADDWCAKKSVEELANYVKAQDI